ncbi:MAG: glycosyltransferase family 39 protein [Burkholderiales bacterium]|nr:glycosyltransferase family 39 protein [Burkholderiales bacterium]
MISQRIAFVVLLCLAWILPGLIGHDPWKPDEAYSFGLVYEILQGGSWVVPTLAGEPFMEKPPLFYLSAAAAAWLFSPPLAPHDAARLATGFYMVLTFLFTGLAGRELYGKNHGAVSALLLLGTLGLVVRTHQLITDVALLAGFAAAFYGLALGLRRPALGGFWLGTGVGVGFMAKGLIAPGILGIVAIAAPLLFQAWRTRRYLLSVAVAAVAVLPWLLIWPLALYQTSPDLFNEWLLINNFGRFLGHNQLGPVAEFAQYLEILPWYAFPVLPIALWTLWDARDTGYAKPEIQLPLLGFLVILLVLSASAHARELYALPMLVPLALLATPALSTLRRGAANAWLWFSAMGFTFFIFVAWFYWVALELGIPERLHHHLHTIQPGYAPGFKLLPFALGVAYTLAWIAIVVGPKRNPQRPVFIWAGGMTAVWGLTAILFIGWLDTGKSYRSMIGSMQQAMPAQYQCVASRNLGEPQRAMLHYFAGMITYREEEPKRARDCDVLLVHGVPQEENVPLGPWQKIWEGSRPGDDRGERFRLYQRTAEKPKRP